VAREKEHHGARWRDCRSNRWNVQITKRSQNLLLLQQQVARIRRPVAVARRFVVVFVVVRRWRRAFATTAIPVVVSHASVARPLVVALLLARAAVGARDFRAATALPLRMVDRDSRQGFLLVVADDGIAVASGCNESDRGCDLIVKCAWFFALLRGLEVGFMAWQGASRLGWTEGGRTDGNLRSWFSSAGVFTRRVFFGVLRF